METEYEVISENALLRLQEKRLFKKDSTGGMSQSSKAQNVSPVGQNLHGEDLQARHKNR